MRYLVPIGAVLAGVVAAPQSSAAFCGFYVSGADAKLFNNATQVVMMRAGTRTVLSMQNNYQGPPSDFAMVVPVPVVLQKDNVKTLPREIFDRVDQLSAPRLVEYWEQDPCMQRMKEEEEKSMRPSSMPAPAPGDASGGKLGVKIEAKFTVGEYQILILSAKDSTGLDTWLRQEKYKIPEGAAPYLKPYVEGGSKFFVAKVDVEKVKFENGQAMLSPLRFHYDTDQFNLPIRLGMMNSAGTQDLIVHILAPGDRYEVANYKNVTIPTNLDVKEEARQRFGEFYAALFDRTLEKNPGAVVTEYSWDASSCDPCPTPALDPNELATLGADVLYGPPMKKAEEKPPVKTGKRDAVDDLLADKSVAPVAPPPVMMPPGGGNFVLSRLHARYSKDGISEDLVFKTAKAIAGGREWRNETGKLEEGAIDSGMNNFQARYAIRHEWTGKIECANPVRGVWGGPPEGTQQVAQGPAAATGLAFVPRGKTQLAQIVRQDVPEIDLKAGADEAPTAEPGKEAPASEPGKTDAKKEKGCGCGAGGGAGGWLALVALGLVLGLVWRRRP
jgi:MYXO-CTERM domain-containing protein